MPGRRDQVGQIRPRRVGPTEVVDDQLEPSMAFRDRADDLEKTRPEEGNGELRTLGGCPQPVEAPIGEPRLLMRAQEREAKPPHPRPAFHVRDVGAALRLIEGKIAEDGEPIGMGLGGLDGEGVGVGIPSRRMDEGRVHAAFVHLPERVGRGVVGDLAMVGEVRGLVVLPEVDLRVDDEHGAPQAFGFQSLKRSRRTFLSNLPTEVLGTASMKRTSSGSHHLATSGLR